VGFGEVGISGVALSPKVDPASLTMTFGTVFPATFLGGDCFFFPGDVLTGELALLGLFFFGVDSSFDSLASLEMIESSLSTTVIKVN
jgi:hypothetical protein